MKSFSPLPLLAVGLLLLASCSAAPVTGSAQLRVSIPQALSSSISRVSVTASAADFPSVTVDLVASQGAWGGTLGNLPAGANRAFLAQAFDASGTRLFEGSLPGVSISTDQTALVTLTLQQVNAPPPFLNEAPLIDSLGASSTAVVVGSSVSLVATAHDPNPGDTLTSAWSSSAGTFSTASSTATSWTAPASTGLQTLTLTVTDPGGLSSRLSLTVNVVPSGGQGDARLSIALNGSPQVNALGASPTRLDVGQSTSVSALASDPDGDSLAYSWSASCAGTWAHATASTAQFTPSALPSGRCNNCDLTVSVSDGRGGQTTGTLALCVSDSPAPQHFNPYLTSISRSSDTATPSQVLTFEVAAHDAEGSALLFSWDASPGSPGTPATSASASRITWKAPTCVTASTTPGITALVTNAFNLTVTKSFPVPGLPVCARGWAPAGAMASPRGYQTATPLLNGKVLVSGGYDGVGALAAAEVYDPASSTWSATPSMASARYLPTATRLPNGRVLVSGGYDTSGALATTELYDPASGTWSPAASMSTPRYGHTATPLANGKLLVVGGQNTGGVLPTAEVYDPAAGTWSPAVSMGTPHVWHTATPLANGKLLVVGGQNTSGILSAAEVYDPASGTWSAAASMTSPRLGHTATPLSTGKVLVAGGQNASGVLSTAELYEPASSSWSPSTSMASPRHHHTATPLTGGKVLVAGGYNKSVYLAQVEVYDTNLGTWSAAANMVSPRYGHTATLLSSGKVLVAGGQTPSTYLTSAEVYDPGALTSCTTDTQCDVGFYCEASACVAKKVNGETCGAANQCASGQCMGNGGSGTVCSELPPSLGSITPTQARAGMPLTLTGTGFVSGSVARVGSTSCTPTSFGSSTALTCTLPALTDGTYAVTVTNPDGQNSTLTGALLVDRTPPAGGGVLNDGTFSRSLTASPALSWTAFTDTGSGIDHYEYAVGTTSGGNQTKDWTRFTPDAGPSTTLAGLTLTSGTTYYPSLRVYDRVGNVSTLTGNGWLVDTTAPLAPTGFNDGTLTRLATDSPTATWSASVESGSGIAYYELAMGTSAGGTDLLNWTRVGNVTSATRTGLTLAAGTAYYTSIRAYDNAGNVSPAVNGDGWTYTLAGPSTLVFLPMDNSGAIAGDNSSADFVNFASSGVSFRPVLAPAISTVSPRFGAGSGCFLNGSLKSASSAANVIGSSDFTIELWVKYSGSLGTFGSPVIFGDGWDISLGNSNYNNNADFSFGAQSARWWGGAVGWGVLPTGVWTHLSISRSGTSLYTHLNGVLKQTVTIAANARLEGTATTSTLTVGGFATAYLDDVLVTVGGVRHTSANFTPTQVGPTPSIYLPMDGPGDGENLSADFRNAVPGGVALVPSGMPTISGSSTDCGGCGNFASGSLATSVAAGNVIGSRDFTIELWVNPSSLGGFGSPVVSGGGTSGAYWDISLGNSYFNGEANFAFYPTETGGYRHWGGDIGWGPLALNTWTHLSLTRLGTSLITHKNGHLVQTVTLLATDKLEGPNTTSAISIGTWPSLLDDVMITVGTARHTTADFPVARAAAPPRLVVKEPYVFLPLDGATGSTAFPNLAASGATFTPVSSPTLTTATSRYGGASGNFQAGSLTTSTSAANVIGTRDFTIEFWVNFAARGTFGSTVVSGAGWDISLGNTNYNNGADFAYGNTSARWWGGAVGWGVLPLNTWTHLAVSRSQDRLYTHKNGVLVSTIAIAPSANMEAGALTSALALGQSASYLDDVMITLGSAKYTTANFGVAPQLAKPFMHLPMDGANLSTSFPNSGTGPAVSLVSSPTLTTTTAVHGGASANLTAGSLTTPTSAAYRLGTQDFTLEFWVKHSAFEFFGSPVVSGNGWDISLGNSGYNNSANFAYYTTENSGYRHWGGDIDWGVLPLNTWVHLSLSRSGTRLYTHKNGVLVSTTMIPATDAMEGPNTTSAITLGTHPCYMDDLLVTIGSARHTTANFTVFP